MDRAATTFQRLRLFRWTSKATAAKPQLQMNWTVPADADLYPGESEEEQVNLALDNPNVVASTEIKTEPGKNAVDGTAKNNSKWCAESATRATLTVSYDEPITVQRYYLIHAGHPDAGEGQNYNTKAWTILASDDGNNWTEIHKVTNNTDYETNVNLDEPVTAKYFRIRMDAPAQSGSVVRLYEFQLFEKPYTFRTDLIEEENVKILENEDGTRKIVVDNLYQGDTVRLYNDSEGTDLVAEQPVESGTSAVFESVNLNKDGGKLFFARQKSGRRESLLRGKRYLGLDAAVTQLDASNIVAVNNPGYTDTLTVGGLSEGDVVKVYKNADDINPMGASKMVTATANSATIQDLQFDKDDSFVYVTVTSPYQKESARVQVATAAEARSDNYYMDFEGADKGLWSNAYGTSDIQISDSLTYTSFHFFSNEAIVIDRNAPSKYDAALSMDVTLGAGSGNMTFYTKYMDRANNLAIQVTPNGTWTYIIRQGDKNVANGTIATGVPLAAETTYALEIRYANGEFVLSLDGEEFGSFENALAAQMYGTFAFKSGSGTRAVTLDNISFEDYIPAVPPVVTGAPESGATRYAVTLTADKEVTWTVNGLVVTKSRRASQCATRVSTTLWQPMKTALPDEHLRTNAPHRCSRPTASTMASPTRMYTLSQTRK
ncbi:MAG: discoidin domain-containing protein [Oscillospiraceae bacterium]